MNPKHQIVVRIGSDFHCLTSPMSVRGRYADEVWIFGDIDASWQEALAPLLAKVSPDRIRYIRAHGELKTRLYEGIVCELFLRIFSIENNASDAEKVASAVKILSRANDIVTYTPPEVTPQVTDTALAYGGMRAARQPMPIRGVAKAPTDGDV